MSDTVGDDNFSGKVKWLKMHGISGNENILGMVSGEAVYRDEIRREVKDAT